jgi:hypothetical protein
VARQRLIKPDYFDDEDLARCCRDARLLGIGLLGQADREGRLEDRPARLRVRLFPFDRDVTDEHVDRWLDELQEAGYLVRYEAEGRRLIWIRRFKVHQHCHKDEQPSILPPYPGASTVPTPPEHHTSTTEAPREHGASTVQGGCKHGAGTTEAPGKPGGVRCTETVYGNGDGTSRARDAAPPAPTPPPEPPAALVISSTDLGDRARVFLQETYPALFKAWRHGAHYRPKEARVFPSTLQLLADYPDDAWLAALVQVWLRTDLPFAGQSDRGVESFISRASWCDDRLREAGFSPEHLPSDAEIGVAAHVAPVANARASPKAVQRAEDLKRGAAWARAGA